MKSVIILSVLSLVVMTLGTRITLSNGCMYVNGICRMCGPGSQLYVSIGCGFVRPEATCQNPNPVDDERAMVCDFSACYCDPPKVRDTTTNKCVSLADCPGNK